MAKCEICGKDMAFGIQVSHSHRRSNRTWKPNIKRVRAIDQRGDAVRAGKDRDILHCFFSVSARREGRRSGSNEWYNK